MVSGWFRHQRSVVCDQQGRHEDGHRRDGPHCGGRSAGRPHPFEVSVVPFNSGTCPPYRVGLLGWLEIQSLSVSVPMEAAGECLTWRVKPRLLENSSSTAKVWEYAGK